MRFWCGEKTFSAACSGLNRIETAPSQECVVRGPHFGCNSLGFDWTRCSSEQLDQLFYTPIRQRLPLLDPLLEQPCIRGTLRYGILDKSYAPIAAPLTVKLKIVQYQDEQNISVSTCLLSKPYVEDGVKDRLECQVERRESLTPVVGDSIFSTVSRRGCQA
jgi:hypothetical protein